MGLRYPWSLECGDRLLGAAGGLGLSGRQPEGEGGTGADLALDHDLAAHEAGELAGEGETEAGAAAAGGAGNLLIGAEDALEILGGDPGPLVAHPGEDIAVVRAGDAHADASARRGELGGIG